MAASDLSLIFKDPSFKKLYGLFYGWGSIASRLQSHDEAPIHFLPLSSSKFLVIIWSILEGWKAETILEPPSGSEHEASGLRIQCLTNRSLIRFYTIYLISLRLRSNKNSLITEIIQNNNTDISAIYTNCASLFKTCISFKGSKNSKGRLF